MKVKDGHMRYRRRTYRKKRIKFIVITAAVCVVALTLLFLIIGNILGNKVEENVQSRKPKQTTAEAVPHASVRSVNARPISLGDKIPEDSGDICFFLEDTDGNALYDSAVAGGGSVRLSKFTEDLHKNGSYAIGIVRLSKFNTENDLTRATAAGYYAALIAEAVRSGVDDVLILASGVPQERLGEVMGIAREVRRLCPDSGAVGLSVGSAILSGEGGSQTFDTLWAAFDYIALDATAPPAEGVSPAEQVNATLGSSLYYLLRYNIRVLLPSADETTLSSMISAANSSGSQNIQVMP